MTRTPRDHTHGLTHHYALVVKAKDAINAIFSDTGVDPTVTKESLEELEAELDVLLNCLEEDKRRNDG